MRAFLWAAVAGLALGPVLATEAILADDPPFQVRHAKLADYVGVWEGKWDNTWKVRYTFEMAPDKASVVGFYENEERVGEPMRQAKATGKLTEGFLRVNRGMDIKISAENALVAHAEGRFPKQTRYAKLTKVK